MEVYLKMKIKEVKVTTVSSELDGHLENRYLSFSYDGIVYSKPRSLMIVEVFTDEDVTGVGIHAHCAPPALFRANVEQITPMVIGENPFYNERIWDKLFKTTYRYGRKGAIIGAISAIDIALWDIKAKVLGKPLYQVLGGFRDKIPIYASGGYYREHNDVEALVEHMTSWVKQGYTALKFKIGQKDYKSDIARVQGVREAVGPDIKIMVDALGTWQNAAHAIKIGKQLEKFDLAWLEEPVPVDDYRGLAEVKRALDTPIASGETQFTKNGFWDMMSHDAVDIIMPDASVCGGITEFNKIVHTAASCGVQVAPHRSAEIHVHLAACMPNLLMTESFPMETPAFREIWKHPYEIKNGYITVPNRPGLGIEINEKAVEKYKVD